uniref:C2H2-type domain-containing protein n=1 Tax=Lepeophtheirus salmonis TaxID=72036 RepID=A0A0K2VAX9_LEPSM
MTVKNLCFLCQEICNRQCSYCEVYFCADNHFESHRNDGHCLPYTICVNPKSGRHFEATRDISAGETILVDEASVVGPATKTEPLCLECFKSLDKVSKKSLCKCGFYLCIECINLNGGHHELECNQIQTTAKHILEMDDGLYKKLEYACVFLLRFWMLRKYNPVIWNRLNLLSSGETKDLEKTKFVEDMVKVMQVKLGAKDITSQDVHQMMGIKRTNASNLSSIGLDGANALYPTYTLMNSHCYCNSRSTIDPKTFQMRVNANRDIKSGEEISTRYVTVLEGQPRRRNLIWSGWKFICECERCEDPTEFGTYFSAIKCLKCSSGFVLQKSSNGLASPWMCESCQKSYGNLEIQNIVDNLEVRIHAHQSNTTSLSSPHSFILETLEEQVHPSHFLVVGLKNKFFFHSYIQNISKKFFDGLNEEEINHLNNKMKEQIKYGYQILSLVETFDPGYSNHKGTILKQLATLKMQFAKLRFCITKDQSEYNDHMGSSMEMIKSIALCI